jgi:hypothetical protein
LPAEAHTTPRLAAASQLEGEHRLQVLALQQHLVAEAA